MTHLNGDSDTDTDPDWLRIHERILDSNIDLYLFTGADPMGVQPKNLQY